jgi:hypothetical protein
MERRTDLDWLRIGALGLLILFHIGMFYAPLQWEVKSPRAVPAVQVVLEWSAPWRLLLLFLVSGAAVRFMSVRMSAGQIFRRRSHVLLLPLLFAVLVVVPPQAYFKVVEQFGYDEGYWRFWLRYLQFDRSFCRDGHCLFLPNWNHMWFVAYLWIYTAIFAGVLFWRLDLPARMSGLERHLLPGIRLLVIPAVVLTGMRIALAHFFPETHGLVDDWYLHVVFLLGFAFGFFLLLSEQVMEAFKRLRWTALLVAMACYALRATYLWHYRNQPIPFELKGAMALVYGFDQWAWIVAAVGFTYRYLSGRDGPVRRYLTQGIFPYYIVHQTAIVVFAHELARWGLPLWLEMVLLVIATVAGCVLAFEIVRRIEWLYPWFGLRRPSGATAVQARRPAAATAKAANDSSLPAALG